jgi:two-component system, cell cycle sensor histidine kinase and response regulator CckA
VSGSSEGQTTTILLVEDDPLVRRAAHRILSMHGFTVVDAGDGEEALRRLDEQSDRIDLVVTDVVMPGMSGRELAAALRERAPGLRVLYMSGYHDDELLRHGLLRDDESFLQKPFGPDELMTKIRELLDR